MINSTDWNFRWRWVTLLGCLLLFLLLEKSECQRNNLKKKYDITNKYQWYAELHAKHKGKIKHICNGAFIANDVVITAAHCVHNLGNQKLYVKFQNIFLQVEKRTDFGYIDSSKMNDIVLLHLRKKRRIKNIHPIKVDDESLDVYYEDIANFLSYKNKHTPGRVQLQQLQTCWLYHYGHLICGVVLSSQICPKDAGGILWTTVNGQNIAIGIISYVANNEECAGVHKNVVFTKIKPYNIYANVSSYPPSEYYGY